MFPIIAISEGGVKDITQFTSHYCQIGYEHSKRSETPCLGRRLEATFCPCDCRANVVPREHNGIISESVAKWQRHWQPRRIPLSHKDLRCVEYFANPGKVGKELDGERTRTVRCQPVGVRKSSLAACPPSRHHG